MSDKYSIASFYAIKGVRLLLIWVAVTVAARLFETDYVEMVYAKEKDPPNLQLMIVTVSIAMLVFNLLLVAGMVAFTSEFRGERALFQFNQEVIRIAAIDSVIHTGIVIIGGLIVTGIIRKKKYFGYETEGVRAIRAAKEMILAFAVPFMVVPYFNLRS